MARTNNFLLNRLSDAKNSDRNFKTEVGVSRYFFVNGDFKKSFLRWHFVEIAYKTTEFF